MRTVFTFLILLLVGIAHAQPTEPDADALEAARVQFEAGNASLDAGKYEEALVAFGKSYELAKRPSALFMLATTYRRRWETKGEIADAKQARQLYGNFVKASPDHASVPYARDQMASLDRQIKETEAANQRGRKPEHAGSPQYRTALGLVAEGKYKDALAQLDAARKAATGPAQLAQIWYVAGRAHALAGQPEAIRAFQRALSIDPELVSTLDMDAPDGQAFARAQQAMRGKAPLSMSADAPPATRSGKVIGIKPSVDSDPMKIVSRVAVRYRAEAESFSEVTGPVGKPLEIPASSLPVRAASYKLMFYVVGYDEAGAIAAIWGSAQDPRRIDVLTAASWEAKYGERKPVYKKWWFWSATAATLATAAVIFLIATPEDPLRGEGPRVDAPLGKPLFRF
jgi:tetratricopeptide (TPR) repeat protein